MPACLAMALLLSGCTTTGDAERPREATATRAAVEVTFQTGADSPVLGVGGAVATPDAMGTPTGSEFDDPEATPVTDATPIAIDSPMTMDPTRAAPEAIFDDDDRVLAATPESATPTAATPRSATPDAATPESIAEVDDGSDADRAAVRLPVSERERAVVTPRAGETTPTPVVVIDCALSTISAVQDGPTIAVTREEGVRLRNAPGTACEVLDELAAGTSLRVSSGEVLAGDYVWVRVELAFGDGEGWIAAEFLDFDDDAR